MYFTIELEIYDTAGETVWLTCWNITAFSCFNQQPKKDCCLTFAKRKIANIWRTSWCYISLLTLWSAMTPLSTMLGEYIGNHGGHNTRFIRRSWNNSANYPILCNLRVVDLDAFQFELPGWVSGDKCKRGFTLAWLRHAVETLSTFLTLCEGNSPVIGRFACSTNNRDADDFRRHGALVKCVLRCVCPGICRYITVGMDLLPYT